MSPDRLLAGGFLAFVGLAAVEDLVRSAGLPLRGRLAASARQAGHVAFLFVAAAFIFDAFVTLPVALVAETFGYERRKDLDAYQRHMLARLVELDETLTEAPIRGDPEAREEQEARQAKAAKERARVWKRFTKKNRVKILPAWLVRAEEYVRAAGPLLFFAWAWWKREDG